MDASVRTQLAGVFGRHMQELLQDEYPAFEESFERERSRALRLNPRKLTPEAFLRLAPFAAKALPWIPGGFSYGGEVRPSQCPLYGAGAYYLQDAGAMTPAAFFSIRPGDLVIDLCAAPGGKASFAGAALQGQGLLVANDISPARARALLRNLELFGIPNALVTSEEVPALAERFAGLFDRVILDAPCSGEGMFRKDPSLAEDWSPEKSQGLARLQRSLLEDAYALCREGGQILYSTCTYERAEDEDAVSSLLASHPDLSLVPLPLMEGFTPGLGGIGIRLYPHRLPAEGHFFAILQKGEEPQEQREEPWPAAAEEAEPAEEKKKKKGGSPKKGKERTQLPPEASLVLDFLGDLGITAVSGQPLSPEGLDIRGEKAYLLPALLERGKAKDAPSLQGRSLGGLSFLRCGLYLGDLKKNRFEPSQPLALALLPGEAKRTLDLPLDSPLLPAYLRGESIPAEGGENAWVLLTCMGLPLAFGKQTGTVLKNKLPASWRT